MIKKIRVTVDGKPFDVTVELPADAAPVSQAPVAAEVPKPEATPPPSAPVADAHAPVGAGDVPSPLAGHVVGIAATVGQEIKQGDPLVTIETMKMNTFVLAPVNGKVTAVEVKVGDAVNEGQILVRIK